MPDIGAASLLFKLAAIPTKAFGKGLRVIGLGEAQHHGVVVVAAKGLRERRGR
jgi:ribosomal protein L18